MFSKFSVKKPMTVLVGVIIAIVLGVVAFSRMTPDLLPNINLPYAVIITAYPGATPEEVEEEVTRPLEQAMATLDHVEEVTSVSRENASQVMLQLTDDANMDTLTADIREKISSVSGGWGGHGGHALYHEDKPQHDARHRGRPGEGGHGQRGADGPSGL